MQLQEEKYKWKKNKMKLQEEMYEWKIKNFGGKIGNGGQMLLGVIEEIGELTHAILKKQQEIRIDVNQNYDDKIKDAIADIYIFYMNYLSEQGIEYKEQLYFIDDSVCNNKIELHIFDLIGYLSQITSLQASSEQFHKMKISVQIAYNSEIFLKHLQFIAKCLGFDFKEIVSETWEMVKKRDWVKFKINGIDR